MEKEKEKKIKNSLSFTAREKKVFLFGYYLGVEEQRNYFFLTEEEQRNIWDRIDDYLWITGNNLVIDNEEKNL